MPDFTWQRHSPQESLATTRICRTLEEHKTPDKKGDWRIAPDRFFDAFDIFQTVALRPDGTHLQCNYPSGETPHPGACEPVAILSSTENIGTPAV